MAAARTPMTGGSAGSEGPGGTRQDEGPGEPSAFRQAVAALRAARPRPEIRLSGLPAPRRLAPYAFALEASVAEAAGEGGDGAEPEELADGRFVLLHNPAGDDAWRGRFRVVTLGRADLEAEMAGDPLLPEVTWSWLTGALEARSAAYDEPSGTVTRSTSASFGGLADRAAQSELEIRASWTPRAEEGAAPDTVPDLAAHLVAWCDLLCQCAGLPPGGDGSPVVPLPQRRGPKPV
ncbi:DUF3000 domain-containing protein [Streptomyces sp. AJS327]|uniref:DUF3000 domain-containing protein n=1 Tax=Streptomyces sp. AJS327 TaxID=2545265 RepID=UPI0015DE8E56|nr:DUF3000 domain-containing protein [Streptomyces sp. AJS327]MBA0052057.1 DUF3000 domain-containing protein [Streptomyces sp. AJS327]